MWTMRGDDRLVRVGTLRDALTEFLVERRGRHCSQRELSDRLGYQSNIVYQWETGRRVPSVESLLRFVRAVGDDASGREARRMLRESALERWVERAMAPFDDDILANALSCSTHVVARMRSGATLPNAVEFLILLELSRRQSLDLLARLGEIHKLPSVAEEYWRRIRVRAVLKNVPHSLEILGTLQTTAFQASSDPPTQWIAARHQVTVAESAFILEQLEMTGLIERRGDETLINFNQTDFLLLLPPFDSAGPQSTRFVSSLSTGALEKYRFALRRYSARVADIWSEDDGGRERLVEGTVRIQPIREMANNDPEMSKATHWYIYT